MNGEIINLQVGSKSQVDSKSVFDSRRPQRTHSLDCHRAGISLYMYICRGSPSSGLPAGLTTCMALLPRRPSPPTPSQPCPVIYASVERAKPNVLHILVLGATPVERV